MVSIIILSYNTKELLHRCLTSIFREVKNIDYEVIVVDNASGDDSVAMIKKEFPKVHLIENKENTGFAKGCNIGAKKAKGEYLLFLNSDSEVQKESIPLLMNALESDTDIAAAGGMLENHDGTPQRSFGAFYSLPSVFRFLFRGEKGELSVYKVDKTTEVDWVSGGSMLVRKKEYEAIGGFDEKFFMYIEDMELCYRFHKMGKKVVFVPEAKIRHMGQGSSNRTFAIVQIYKGLQYFYKKHKNPLQYTMVRFLLMVKGVLALFVGLISGNRTLMSTYSQALRTL